MVIEGLRITKDLQRNSSEWSALWSQLDGCWSGIVMFDGVPGVHKDFSTYQHCCYASTRMVETRLFFSLVDGVPVVARYFDSQLIWHLDDNVHLSLSGVVSSGLNEILNLSQLVSPPPKDGGEELSVKLRPFRPFNAWADEFECNDIYLQHDAQRLVVRAVVYYPTYRGDFLVLHSCPAFHSSFNSLPVPERCVDLGVGVDALHGCRPRENDSNELGIHKEGVTFIEYALTRYPSDYCEAANLISTSSDDDSSGTMLHTGAIIALVFVSALLCLAPLPFLRRYCRTSSSLQPAFEVSAQSDADVRGAQSSGESGSDLIIPSSGVDFQGDSLHILACGHVEHWLVPIGNLGDFKLVEKGGFGAVFSGMMHKSSKVAIKTIKEVGGVNTSHLQALQHEIRILRRIRHPNIVLFQGITIMTYEGANHLALVLEWVGGGHMGKYLRSQHEKKVSEGLLKSVEVTLMMDISRALMYLHNQTPAIYHRDLKPENVLIEKVKPPRAKVTDFGLSALVKGETVTGRVGTRHYMAPEVWEKQSYDASADMYSYGCIMWFVLTGSRPPLEDAKAQAIAIRDSFPEPDVFIELCIRCLDADAESRPSVADAHEVLSTLAETIVKDEVSTSDVQSKPSVAL
eukprot:TRINITY_DN6317_c0_g1_i1.p1 TRINITY_DN6317_c0_g1~~TRINITY_DN6317_c0_g1_i1.p1  ORF type:complete len:629 (+),score=49.95 TRINITY_DN6317_c0_g1_i1:79-1965(+)